VLSCASDSSSKNFFWLEIIDCIILIFLEQGESELFLNYAQESLQSKNVESRPSVSEVLNHHYFKNDFLEIVQFLTDLPIKSDAERKIFFESLTEKVFHLPEKLVASMKLLNVLSLKT